MKILAPINTLKLIPFYKSLGIKEVYGGFVDRQVQAMMPSMGLLNGRPTENANFSNLEDFQEAIDLCRESDIKFHVTFNLLPYLGDDKLLDIAVKNLRSLNFESIILSDVNLLPYFNDKEIVISTLSNIYNSEHIKYLSQFNVKKIVLPRELSIKEQKNIIEKFPEMEFELLILNDWCYNNDGTCSSVHYKFLPDGILHSCQRDKDFSHPENKEFTAQLHSLTSARGDCKTCLMYFFEDFIDRVSFKIAGRSKNIHSLKKDMLYAVNAYKYMSKFSDYNSYNTANMNLYNKIYGNPCKSGNCEMYNKYRTI